MNPPVALAHACRLINHGPTVLVGAAYGGRRNLMAAAWSMPHTEEAYDTCCRCVEGGHERCIRAIGVRQPIAWMSDDKPLTCAPKLKKDLNDCCCTLAVQRCH